MRRARLSVLLIAALAASGGLTVLGGCPAPADSSSSERICTPGNNVYCRCEDRSEGTKLCDPGGNTFGDCRCSSSGGVPPPGYLNQDAGYTHIDAAPAPDAGPPITSACGGKLAVIASTDQEDPNDSSRPLYLYGAAYQPDGTWIVGQSKGGPLRGLPSGTLVGTTLVVAWQSLYELIGWTTFDPGQQDIVPELSLGNAYTTKAPALVGAPGTARIYSVGADDLPDPGSIHEGVYTPGSHSWDDATQVVSSAPDASFGAPAADLLATGYVLAYGAADGSVLFQQQSGGTWGAATPVPGAALAPDAVPRLTALAGGTDDLLLVYVGTDFALHAANRKAGDAAFAAPSVIDAAAVSEGDPSMASLSGGRAIVVYKAINGAPYFTIYDPTKTPAWSTPASYFAGNPQIGKPPSVARGKCGGEISSAYVDATGAVNVALFTTDRGWNGPYVVPGLTKITWAGAGEVP